jgi:pSer/pThr/pTyr-binding forkhead associated (FHA) protein
MVGMMRKPLFTLWLVCLWLALIALPFAAVAQTVGQATIHIHDVADPEPVTTATGSTGLSLEATFSLIDSDQQVLREVEIDSGSIELDGDSYGAIVQGVKIPWSIVLLVDGSATMGNFRASADFKTATTTLANSLGQAPDDTTFALISFDDRAPTSIEFTSDNESVTNAIKRLRAKSGGHSCLNDGLYEAINKLGGAPGRRSVVVFTASADDCATHSVQDVVGLAEENRVQIYAVGLQGYSITAGDLDALVSPTGGLYTLKDASTLSFAFGNMMNVLANQWEAKATLYPTAGNKTATLVVTLKDGTVLRSSPISFVSTQDFVRPTEIHLIGKVQSTSIDIRFTLGVVRPEQIKQLNVAVISADTGLPVFTQSLGTFSETNKVPASNLVAGADYSLVVTAVDDQGRTLSEDKADFKYEPAQATLAVESVAPPTVDQPEFVVTLATQNIEGVVKYKIWLAQEQTNAIVSGTETTIPVGEPLVLPTGNLASGQYLLIVQALDSTDKVLAEAAPVKTAYERPTAVQAVLRFVGQSPWAIAGLTGLCCLTVIGAVGLVWFVMPKRRDRTKTVDLVLPQKERRAAPIAEKSEPPRSPPQEPVAVRPPSRPPTPPPTPQAMPIPQAPPRVQAPGPAAKPAVPHARVVGLEPAGLSFTAEIDRTSFSLGRRQDNDGPIPVDSSQGVSGQHLKIIFSEGKFFVQDDKSTFGTTVNGQPVPKGRPVPLEDGAVIGLGPVVKVRFIVGGG